MPDDLIERLLASRKFRISCLEYARVGGTDATLRAIAHHAAAESTDALSRLQAENRRLREELAQFAGLASHYEGRASSSLVDTCIFTVGDLRRAAAALKETGTDDNGT